MPALPLNTPMEFTDPDFTGDGRSVGVGTHVFTLEVVDDGGRRSAPMKITLVVRPPKRVPVAVLDVPARVKRGQAVTLSGERSVAAPERRLVRFLWQVEIPNAAGLPSTTERETRVPVLEVPGSAVAGRFRLNLIVEDDLGTVSEPHSATLVIA